MSPEAPKSKPPLNEAERVAALLNLERRAGGLDDESANVAAKALGIKLKGTKKSN